MTTTQPTTDNLRRAVRPVVDLSGERQGNTAKSFMRYVHQSLGTHPDVIVHATVHDGQIGEMRPFYVVPQELMRALLAKAGVDYRDIPNHHEEG